MSRTTKFCSDCEQNNNPPKCPGFLVGWEDTPINECPFCKNKNLITYDISDDDILLLGNISTDISFIEAMIKLKQDDIIEYNLKMSQFRSQVGQQKQESSSTQIKCPTCSSNNITKISTTAKVTNIALFGLLGNKRKKTFHCNNCKYEW